VMSDTPMDRIGIRDRVKESISSRNLHPHGSNFDIGLVSIEDIPYIWDQIESHLERAVPHSEGELEPDDFMSALADGEMQLWVALQEDIIVASMITQIASYPRKRVLKIITIAGEDMHKWIDNLYMVEDWALEHGCTSLECWGRKGWLKVLKDWKCSYHIITKDLKGRMH